jgi:RecA-family ATPase
LIPPIDQARRYLAKIDPAVSGQNGHDKTYHVACLLVNGFGLGLDEARTLLHEYSEHCQPPWTESEIEHKLGQASAAPEPKGKRHLLRNGVSYRYGQSDAPRPMAPLIRRDEPVKSFAGKYQADPFSEIPLPMADGTRELIKAAFAPGEGIKIAQGFYNSEGKEIPKGNGATLSREEWLRKLDAHGGDVNGFMRTSERNGIFCAINPLRIGGTKDSDVTSYRHCLMEWDGISQEEQWSLISQSNIPCTAVIRSGGKSIHAWVNIDAANRKEFNERVKLVHEHFGEWPIDPQNKNPSRFSRLAGCERGKNRQELLALKIGAPSFSEWQAALTVESVGRVSRVSDLMKFDVDNDATTLLGKRWLCKGGSAFFVGQSGLGKSSFAIQAAATWAIGGSMFGICHPERRPLRSLFIQSENDEGDLAEMCQGVLGPLGLNCGPDLIRQVDDNLIIVTDTCHTGFEFCQALQKLIDRYKPDFVWLDPFLRFFGENIGDQFACSQFLTQWLGPITTATGVCWMIMHHTGKPSTDPKSKSKWSTSDFAYAGLGSSELTNWPRAVCNLDRFDESTFSFLLSKRGKRAHATDLLGNATCRIWLRHADTGIRWEQCAEPDEAKKAKRKFSGPAGATADSTQEGCETPNVGGRPSKIGAFMDHVAEFQTLWSDDETLSLGQGMERLDKFCRQKGIEMGETTLKSTMHTLIDEFYLHGAATTKDGGYEISR